VIVASGGYVVGSGHRTQRPPENKSFTRFLLLKVDWFYFIHGGVNVMRRKSKIRSAVFSLAVCAGIFCAWCCVLLMAGEYYSAQRKLNVSKQELQTWEACRSTKPSYFRSNAEAVSACLKNFNEARENRWMSLPKEQLVGLFVLAAVASAVGGGLATWAVVWLVFLSIYRLLRLLACCFMRHPGRQVNS
jgi:hypothetical protein